MTRNLSNNRQLMMVMALIVAFVAIVIPTCRMVGCSMEMGSSMSMAGHGSMGGAVLNAACGGQRIFNSTPNAIVPSGADSLTLALVAAVIAALSLMLPTVSAGRSGAFVTAPIPPPLPVRGERTRL